MIINNNHIKVRRFNSGEMRLLYKDFLPLAENGKIDIIYNGEETLFELAIIIKFLQDCHMQINLTLTYLPYQRMDHNNGHEANTLKYVAELINSLHVTNLYICEPHCNLDFFKNAKAISFVDLIYGIATKEIGFDENKDYLIFTDKGSKQKYGHLGKNHIYFEKQRAKDSGQIVSHKMIGNIKENCKAILIDDIISSGETILNCIKLLDVNQKIYIVTGHFEKNKLNKRILSLRNVEKVFSSNSLTKLGNAKLRLFKCEDLINKGENK